MKLFFFTNLIILTIVTVAIKLTIINQNNEIKILEKKMTKLEKDIEKLEIDFAYISSPKKLKEINDKEFKLNPNQHEDWVILEK